MALPAVSTTIYSNDNFSLINLGQDRLEENTRFVHSVYQNKFGELHNWDGAGLEELLNDDQHFAPQSRIFASIDNQTDHILATARLIQREDCALPIETDFDVDLHQFLDQRDCPDYTIFEVGRLARRPCPKSDTARNRSIKQGFLAVVGGLVMYTTAMDNAAVFGTADEYVLNLVQRRGYTFEQIGPSRMYVGSPTVPVFMDVAAWKAQSEMGMVA